MAVKQRCTSQEECFKVPGSDMYSTHACFVSRCNGLQRRQRAFIADLLLSRHMTIEHISSIVRHSDVACQTTGARCTKRNRRWRGRWVAVLYSEIVGHSSVTRNATSHIRIHDNPAASRLVGCFRYEMMHHHTSQRTARFVVAIPATAEWVDTSGDGGRRRSACAYLSKNRTIVLVVRWRNHHERREYSVTSAAQAELPR